jgi:hypothetical protein
VKIRGFSEGKGEGKGVLIAAAGQADVQYDTPLQLKTDAEAQQLPVFNTINQFSILRLVRERYRGRGAYRQKTQIPLRTQQLYLQVEARQ